MVESFGMPEFDPVLNWLESNEPAFAQWSMNHNDLHPWNVIVEPGGRPVVIDWTNATVGDHRFDLAWTLLLMESNFDAETSQAVLSTYESVSGHKVEDFDFFEVGAAARRLFDITVSLRHGASAMGMLPGAAAEMVKNRSTLDVPLRFIERMTGIRLAELDAVFPV